MKIIRTRQRLAALGLLALVCLTFPLLGLPSGGIWGVPASVFYLFAVWCVVILLAWLVAERLQR